VCTTNEPHDARSVLCYRPHDWVGIVRAYPYLKGRINQMQSIPHAAGHPVEDRSTQQRGAHAYKGWAMPSTLPIPRISMVSVPPSSTVQSLETQTRATKDSSYRELLNMVFTTSGCDTRSSN